MNNDNDLKFASHYQIVGLATPLYSHRTPLPPPLETLIVTRPSLVTVHAHPRWERGWFLRFCIKRVGCECLFKE
jgi:hypothetical protein